MAFPPFLLDEQCSHGLVMPGLLQHIPPTSSAPSRLPPTPISASHVYKTPVSKSQFKWTHPFVQQKVASGVAPCEAHRPELHMAGLQMRTGYDLFMTTMCVWCPVPAGCGFPPLPQSGMTYLLIVSHFRYCIPEMGKRRCATRCRGCTPRRPQPCPPHNNVWPNTKWAEWNLLQRSAMYNGFQCRRRSSCWNDWPCGAHETVVYLPTLRAGMLVKGAPLPISEISTPSPHPRPFGNDAPKQICIRRSKRGLRLKCCKLLPSIVSPLPPTQVVFILWKKLTWSSSHLGVLDFWQALVTLYPAEQFTL